MLITRAPFATAQRIAFASASTGIEPLRPDDLRDQRAAPAARARRCRCRRSSCAAIRPATNVPCPCVSTVAEPSTKLFAAAIRPRSSGWRAVDARVDHGDPARRRAAAARSTRRTTGSGRRTTAAAGTGRSGRTTARRLRERLDVPHTRHAAQRARAARRVTARAAIGARSTIRVAPRAASCSRSAARSAAGATPTANRAASRRRRAGQAEHDGRDERRGPRDHFAGPAGTVIVSAGPAWPSAVSR